MFSELQLFDQAVRTPLSLPLGSVTVRDDVKSAAGPFRSLPGYKTLYPDTVLRALGQLYVEYNREFSRFIRLNREWETDYRYCTVAGHPLSFPIRIDMVGLPQSFLDAAADMSVESVREVLRRRIFEFENAFAMYQLFECLFEERNSSLFRRRFRAFLDGLRRRFGKPIALLAVTEEKYLAMKATEFGKEADEPLTDAEVRELSGFDRFFSPEEFRGHVKECGTSMYLLCARTSDPVFKQRDPRATVLHPLLGDPAMRRVIKEHSLTLNIDNPDWPLGDPRRINDTKAYMGPLGAGFEVKEEADLLSSEFIAHMVKRVPQNAPDFHFQGERLSKRFLCYLKDQGVDPQSVISGRAALRCKPLQGTYGCYGHITYFMTKEDLRGKLKRGLRQRGPYLVQPEMDTPRIINTSDDVEYSYIDRVWFNINAENEAPKFMSGVRSLMPASSVEVGKSRNHGNGDTVWAEIFD